MWIERKNIKWIFILVVASLSVVIYILNNEMSKSQLEAGLEEMEKEQKEWLPMQVNAIQVRLNDSTFVTDSVGQQISLSELTEDGTRMGLYISTYQCSTCWQSELEYFYSKLKNGKYEKLPFVLVGVYSFLIIWKRVTSDFAC